MGGPVFWAALAGIVSLVLIAVVTKQRVFHHAMLVVLWLGLVNFATLDVYAVARVVMSGAVKRDQATTEFLRGVVEMRGALGGNQVFVVVLSSGMLLLAMWRRFP